MKIECPQFSPMGDTFGRCAKGLYGGNPSHRTCLTECTYNPANAMGVELDAVARGDGAMIGDRLEALAKRWGADKVAEAFEYWTGIPCGCPGRKALVNRLHTVWRGIVAGMKRN